MAAISAATYLSLANAYSPSMPRFIMPIPVSMPLNPASMFTIFEAPTIPIGTRTRGYKMPKFTLSKKGKAIVVTPTLTAIKGTEAIKVKSGFCHCLNPDEASLLGLMIRSSKNPIRVIIKI